MNKGIPTGLIPPRPGLEREEPEMAYEEDIPRDDRNSPSPDAWLDEGDEQPRRLERE